MLADIRTATARKRKNYIMMLISKEVVHCILIGKYKISLKL